MGRPPNDSRRPAVPPLGQRLSVCRPDPLRAVSEDLSCTSGGPLRIIIVDTVWDGSPTKPVVNSPEVRPVRVKVRKWGNSLALRIPKPFAAEVKVDEGTVLDLSIRDRKLVASPVSRRRYTLRQLLARVTKDNVHAEVDWGAAVGREAE